MEHLNQIAILFPGQGSQTVGMGADFYQKNSASKELFVQIDQIAGRSLSALCFDGPAEELKRTINTQPAILAASLVAWKAYLQAGGPSPRFVAGHSLGEFSALYAADVLSLEAVIPLVEQRAKLMEACPPGAMTAVLSMKYERLKEICATVNEKIPTTQAKHVVVVANFNTEEQLVISGDPDSVLQVNVLAKGEGAKVIPLAVGGAFHSPLMSEAAKEFAQALDKCNFDNARFPVVQNVTAQPQSDGAILKEVLKKQMISSVLWYDTIKFMLDQGINTFIEIGPGKALSGMVKRISKNVQVYNIEDSASLENTLNALNTTAAIK